MDSNIKALLGFFIGGVTGYFFKQYITNSSFDENLKPDNNTTLVTRTTFEKAIHSGCNIQSILFDVDTCNFIWENTQQKILEPESYIGDELVNDLRENASREDVEISYYVINSKQSVCYMVTRVRKEIAETPKESEENPNEHSETRNDDN